jgi:diketogulonate reductase-like aldo/keto reductase
MTSTLMTSTSGSILSNTDAIEAAGVPQRVLYTGAIMPAIGLGTFGSDHVSHQAVADAVVFAAQAGYRHFDCASVYGNEDRIGLALNELFRSGLKREEVWITSKLWNDKHAEGDVIASCEKSLLALRLD